jgi:hypothetical protein
MLVFLDLSKAPLQPLGLHLMMVRHCELPRIDRSGFDLIVESGSSFAAATDLQCKAS